MGDGDKLFIDDKFPILSLVCTIEFCLDGIILKHLYHVAEISEGVVDGDNIHFGRIKSNPGGQAPSTARSVYFDIHHDVSGMWLALQKNTRLSVKGKEQRTC